MKQRVVAAVAVVVLLAAFGYGQGARRASGARTTGRLIKADVVALDQAFYNNRLGAFQAGGMIFALRRDVVSNDGSPTLTAGNVMLRPDKRPRPIVLRMDVGDCMEVSFENLLASVPSVSASSTPVVPTSPYNPANSKDVPDNSESAQSQSATRLAGVHVMGVSLEEINADGSWVGANDNSLIAPGKKTKYRFCADAEGAYMLYSTGADVGTSLGFGGQLMQGLFGALMVEPKSAEWYRSQVTRQDLELATKGKTPDGHPIINYQAVYPPGFKYPGGTPVPPGTPILAMMNKDGEIVHSDLTAVITGPNAGLFPENDGPSFDKNPTYPDRRQPFREFAIHYHDDFVATQAFPEFSNANLPVNFTLSTARDFFAINYGMAAIGPEVWANRIKVGPMYQCDTCKFEEFFLSSWAVGDPAMVVDFPANSIQEGNYIVPGPKATRAFYPDDPSNVYHSYMGDHVQFRILHAGTNITHVHHQHAHQWLHTPNSDESDYRDSQMISPGGAYTLDMTYFGSGNLNQTVGDSIFHCHFYPHFAQGMWSLWRVHDVFEEGTHLDKDQRPETGWNRALPDGEITHGTPIPALVPMPEIPMAPIPAKAQVCAVYAPKDFVELSGEKCPDKPSPIAQPVGFKTLISKLDLDSGKNPGYPFFIPGVAGQRTSHPPLDFAPEEDKDGRQVVKDGKKQYLDGGLPRLQVLQDIGNIYEHHNRWDFSKDNDSLVAVELDEEGTSVEKQAMAFHAKRKHPSFTPEGNPGDFILNGQGPKPGAPYADPAVDIHGNPIPNSDCEKHEAGCIRYKAADIQTDVVLNKKGWHYPQQRLLALWGDVKDTFDGNRRPEPLFFRANSEKVIEYWHANLVPNYYELDDFQVRTPTDILGQHIHLVKFDVTSSDGAGNGFNYEDGTFSPEEVVDQIHQINKANGLFNTTATGQFKLAPKEIPYFQSVLPGKFPGAQATIQRWYADPVFDCKHPIEPGAPPLPCKTGQDRTLRTVFTHDHFGPSTHQQIGLYAGLVIEPTGSKWFNSTTGEQLGGRFDGGPTTYQANIILPDPTKSYREFMLEFQDRQLAYLNTSITTPLPYIRYDEPKTTPPGFWGWADPTNAINAPQSGNPGPGGSPTPDLVTNRFSEGAYSLNYSNEPTAYRIASGTAEQTNLANVFRSIKRADASLNVQPPKGSPINTALTMSGAVVNGNPVWERNGTPLANNSATQIQPGQTITFNVASGTHGITFLDKATALAVFDFGSPGVPFQAQTSIGPNAWGTPGESAGTLATLRVKDNIPSGITQVAFECTVHQKNMAGVFIITRNAITISGAFVQGKGVFWELNGVQLANNSVIQIEAGQTITFNIAAGFHGITFLDKSTAESVFDFGSPGLPFKPQPSIGPNAWGTDGATSGTLATLKVKDNIPNDIAGLAFECTIHQKNMAGTFNLGFRFPPPQVGVEGADPYTPTLRAYEGDNIQIRNLVGAHMGPHAFHLHGLNWQFEPSYTDSGFRSTQGMSLSEHYELLFKLPHTSQPKLADYLYIPTSDTTGLQYGNWGLLRGYKDKQPDLVPLSDSQKKAFPSSPALPADAIAPVCPADAPKRTLNVTAVFARDALGGPLVYNARGVPGTLGQEQIVDWNALMYVHTEDLQNGKLKPGVPREPLVLRAAAGDCITVNLTNALPSTALNQGEAALPALTGVTMQTSPDVGLHPQLVNVDVTTSDGFNIGLNDPHTVSPGKTGQFTWYAGKVDYDSHTGQFKHVPVEFGAISLAPVDPLMQDNFGLIGGLIVEPQGATWQTDDNSYASATVKVGAAEFREAVAAVQDDLASLRATRPVEISGVVVQDSQGNNNFFWSLNGVNLTNGSKIPVRPGDTVAFYAGSGKHGVTFFNKQNAEAFFNFGQSAAVFKAQPAIGPDSWGTDGQTATDSPVLLAVLTVRKDLPATLKELPFECTVHQQKMQGTLVLDALFMEGDVTDNGVQWVRNGDALANDSVTAIKPGQTITFAVGSGTHGITFLDKATAQAVFDFGTPGIAFQDQPSIGPNAWGTPGETSGTLATLKVKDNIPSTITTIAFECTIHEQNMAGSFVLDRSGSDITMSGAVVSGSVKWERNGLPLDNNSATQIQPDQNITFNIANGFHGITFLDKATAEAVFDFGSPGLPFKPQPTIGPNAWGTDGATSGALATLKVKHTLPAGITSVPFECTIHKQNMAGVFQIGSAPIVPLATDPANTQIAINYRTEPFAYRYLNSNYLENTSANSPAGISRAMSNTLVAADPETPVFVAEAGKPLRIRMLHPAGVNEQVFELHGHNWQEEPYKNNSTVIGDNPLSQSTGSRDTFGPNASFDAVLKQAGGSRAVKGDYLFRTFIGTDYLLGMWGIVRVGTPGQDVVTLNQFCQMTPPQGAQLSIQGVNTVNPANHHMATSVTIFSGTGSSLTQIGTAAVDRMTGAWSFAKAINPVPTAITVKSQQGGAATASAPICPISQNWNGVIGKPASAAPAPAAQPQGKPLPARTSPNKDEVDRFRPAPPAVHPSSDKGAAPQQPEAQHQH